MHPSIAFGALVACDVASTYWTGILCSRAWVWMYIARTSVGGLDGVGPVVVVAAL